VRRESGRAKKKRVEGPHRYSREKSRRTACYEWGEVGREVSKPEKKTVSTPFHLGRHSSSEKENGEKVKMPLGDKGGLKRRTKKKKTDERRR